MRRVSRGEKYLLAAYSLFKQRGLKLTMEEIAEGLGVTKKTLYNNFKSKEVLLRTVMQQVIEEIGEKIEISLSQGSNAVEALFHTSEMMNLKLEEVGPLLLADSAQLLPDFKMLKHTNRLSFYSKIICENLERGVSEGLYRTEIDRGLVTLFFTSAMAKIYSWDGAYTFLGDPYRYHSELVRYHLAAIVNERGREILNSYLPNR